MEAKSISKSIEVDLRLPPASHRLPTHRKSLPEELRGPPKRSPRAPKGTPRPSQNAPERTPEPTGTRGDAPTADRRPCIVNSSKSKPPRRTSWGPHPLQPPALALALDHLSAWISPSSELPSLTAPHAGAPRKRGRRTQEACGHVRRPQKRDRERRGARPCPTDRERRGVCARPPFPTAQHGRAQRPRESWVG